MYLLLAGLLCLLGAAGIDYIAFTGPPENAGAIASGATPLLLVGGFAIVFGLFEVFGNE